MPDCTHMSDHTHKTIDPLELYVYACVNPLKYNYITKGWPQQQQTCCKQMSHDKSTFTQEVNYVILVHK